MFRALEPSPYTYVNLIFFSLYILAHIPRIILIYPRTQKQPLCLSIMTIYFFFSTAPFIITLQICARWNFPLNHFQFSDVSSPSHWLAPNSLQPRHTHYIYTDIFSIHSLFVIFCNPFSHFVLYDFWLFEFLCIAKRKHNCKKK